MGVYFLPHDHVAHILSYRELRDFFRIFRLMIDSIGRTEERRFHAQDALDQPLRQIQLPMNLSPRDFVKGGVRVRVIPDLVAFGVFALHNFRPTTAVRPYHEKRSGSLLFSEDTENSRSPLWIGSIVKRDGNLAVCRTDLIDAIGEWIGFVFFRSEQIASRVVGKAAPALLGRVRKTPDVTIPFQYQVGPGRKVLDFLTQRIVRPRRVPDGPNRGVRRTQPPQRGALHAEALAGPQI